MIKKTVSKKQVGASTPSKGVVSATRRNGGGAPRPSSLKAELMIQGQRKSIKELATELRVKPTRLHDILGKGTGLWDSDHELERFVEDIYARRKEDREITKQ